MKFLLGLLLFICISACGSTASAPPLSTPISSLDSAPPTQQAGHRAISLPLPGFIPNRIPLAEIDLASFPLPIQISNYTLIWDAQIDEAPSDTLAQSMPGSGVTFAANELDPGTYTLTATAYSPSDADLITPLGSNTISFILGIPTPTPSSTPTATPSPQCCRVCTTGKACGNSCINIDFQCFQPPGCACNASDLD